MEYMSTQGTLAETTVAAQVIDMYTRASLVRASPEEVAKLYELLEPVQNVYVEMAGPDGETVLNVCKEHVEAYK